MKYLFFFTATLLTTAGAFSQKTYKDLPVIEATGKMADYRYNDNWRKGTWTITPEASPDVLTIPCFQKTVAFAFYTDRDSIVFPLNGSTTKQFYVHTADDKYALTEIRGFDYKAVTYDASPKKAAYHIQYENSIDNPFLNELKARYPIQQLVKGQTSDSAGALRVLKWVHDQWKHNGANEPKKRDALSILEEVKEGKNFRCVEYGIVTTAALNAIGLPAGVLALKTKDVETTSSGAGHVLLEVYLKDLQKWALLDGQWDAMPVLNGIPLNAVEFQQAIANHYDQLEIRSLSGTTKADYAPWVYPYLYYLDVPFDNREGTGLTRQLHQGTSSLMLVPQGAKSPTVFQQNWPSNNVVYTTSTADFYAPPL